MNTKALIKILLWLSAMALLRVYSGPLVFAPAPGTTLGKRFTYSAEFELVELELTIGGLDIMEYWLHGLRLETEHAQDVLVSDRYIRISGGQPQVLDRSFESLAQTLDVTMYTDRYQDPYSDWDQALTSSDLEHSSVEFRWDGEQFEKTFKSPRRQRDDRLLDGLTENMDLRMLLPNGTAEVGDTWDFDLATLPDLISPGGYFSWGTDQDNEIDWLASMLHPALVGELREQLTGLLRGEATVLYAEESEGLSLLEFEVDARACTRTEDLERLAERIVNSTGESLSIEIESLHLDLDVQVTGTAGWDSTRGHLRETQLTGELESCLELSLLVFGFGSEYQVVLRTVVRGEFEQQVSVE